METKDIIRQLRLKQGLSQEELAQKTYVTRQAVSRWETGETLPNPQTLTVLSKLFDVSVNTLLGAPRTLVSGRQGRHSPIPRPLRCCRSFLTCR